MKIYQDSLWKKCRSCNAPLAPPLPEGGTYTVVRSKFGAPDKVTTHYEDCPKGFKKIEVPDV